MKGGDRAKEKIEQEEEKEWEDVGEINRQEPNWFEWVLRYCHKVELLLSPLSCVYAPWLEIAYVQIKDFPLLFSCRLRVAVDRRKRTFLSEKWTLRNKSPDKTAALTDRCAPLRGRTCDTLKELPFKCSLSPDLYQCEQTHLNRAVSLIWCCSKDISKWIGLKIILFTSINRSILATSNQMRCSMCRSRDSALCLPTLRYRESTVHKFSWTKLFFFSFFFLLLEITVVLMLHLLQQNRMFFLL